MLALSLIAASAPAAARLVSVDPVQANPNTGANFNRYWYGNNNPYKFIDPDGRTGRIIYQGNTITVEVPTKFVGTGATAENIATVKGEFESQSGSYNVGGREAQVNFRVAEITSDTPTTLRNTVNLSDGPTDHPNGKGGNYADSVGGTKASLDVNSRGFQNGAGGHEMDHLAGAPDAYLRDGAGNKIPDPNRTGDILNQLPGKMTDTTVNQILNAPSNETIRE